MTGYGALPSVGCAGDRQQDERPHLRRVDHDRHTGRGRKQGLVGVWAARRGDLALVVEDDVARRRTRGGKLCIKERVEPFVDLIPRAPTRNVVTGKRHDERRRKALNVTLSALCRDLPVRYAIQPARTTRGEDDQDGEARQELPEEAETARSAGPFASACSER